MIFDLRIAHYDTKVFTETEMGMGLVRMIMGVGKGYFGGIYTTTIRQLYDNYTIGVRIIWVILQWVTY
jgi:hypothetical protein